jgi:phosphoglycerate dehydrogenase-like enzyme
MAKQRYEAAFFVEKARRDRFYDVYGEGRKERLESTVPFFPEIVGSDSLDAVVDDLSDVKYIFSTWGMPALSEAQIAKLPSLEAVFYAAGSVQYFARPFLNRGVTVVSAWQAIAVPVASYTLAQILLASKGYFSAVTRCRTPGGRAKGKPDYPGIWNITVSILGAGTVGGRVIELLKPYGFEILVFDPYLSDQRANDLGVTKVSLDEAFERGFIVSNHIANLPETEGMLAGDHFRKLQTNATFINTGRGATVEEQAMLDVFRERKDLTALLDVTWPEPPDDDSPIYQMENVWLTPHIAGSLGKELLLQADYVIEEFHRLREGKPLRYAVTLEMLKSMA